MMTFLTSTPWRRVRPAALLLFTAAALAACGDNLFETGTEPELNAFNPSAESVAEGDTLVFSVDASGPRTINRVRVVLSGALEADTTFSVDEPGADVSGEIRLGVPHGTGPGSTLTVTATAIDVSDAASEAVTVSVQVTDATPPTVSGTIQQTEVGAGDPIAIQVTGSDNRGLQTLGAAVTDNSGYDTTLVYMVSPASVTASHTFQLVAPPIDFAELVVTPLATDVSDLESQGEAAAVLLTDQQGPGFLLVETRPDSTIPLQDSLQVIVEVADPSGIQQVTFIGLAYRGEPSMGTDSVVERFAQKTITFPRPTEGGDLPTRYTLNPYLLSADDTTSEAVEVFVIAEDALGNVSDTTKMMYVGGPDVGITYPPEAFAVGLGAQFNVRVTIEDATGIDSAKVVLRGSTINQEIDLTLPARTDTAFLVTQAVTMPTAEDVVEIQARAWNPAEVRGQSRVVSVEVLAEAPTDTEPPVVSLTAERLVPVDAGDRMEVLDEIRVVASAFDGNAGLARLGLTAVASRAGQQHVLTREQIFDRSNDLEELVFQVPVDSLYALFGISDPDSIDALLPESIDLRFHAFAADAVGEVACAVGIEEQRRCSPDGYSPLQFYEAADTAGLLVSIDAVRGVTILLDNRDAQIADIAVDTVDDRLYLSNISENLVELLQLNADFRQTQFRDLPVQVGSEPWGVFLGDRIVGASEPGFGIGLTPGTLARTLIVANSGGTNMSLVHLDPNVNNVQEVDVVRLRTPNSILYQVATRTDEFGRVEYTVTYYDLSDRPQFLAQDSLLRIVYSTIPTQAAPLSSVRFAHVDPDITSASDRPEVRFLLTGDMVQPTQNTIALANIDSLLVKAITGASDSVKVYTHQPGYPDSVIVNANWEAELATAVDEVRTRILAVMTARGMADQAGLFYPFAMRGTWDLQELAWSDTTYVSASEDRGKIVIGEGATSPTGRIMMWHGDTSPAISDEVQISDLVSNASEEVLGVGLNENGSLGVARGREATYFFTPDLRLQGMFRQDELGGAGAAFHPDHDDITDGGHTDGDGDGVAFTGTSNHSIDVVNTFHFNRVNKLVIRDDIVGPLVTGPPLATDNNGQGAQCVALNLGTPAELSCIVAKVYAITDAGGVVVVNVRRRDLEPYSTP